MTHFKSIFYVLIYLAMMVVFFYLWGWIFLELPYRLFH